MFFCILFFVKYFVKYYYMLSKLFSQAMCCFLNV